MLPELEMFERSVADPTRFYRHNSHQREQESQQREQLTSKLKNLELDISKSIKAIDREYRDVVKFRGIISRIN